MAQVTRLSSTNVGKTILEKAGIDSTLTFERATPLPQAIGEIIVVHQLPRNMHPIHNVGRRKARAKAILEKLDSRGDGAIFVDAARMTADKYTLAVVNKEGRLLNAATVQTKSASIAEQVAISLAMTMEGTFTIFTDSMSAVRAFDSNHIAEKAAMILTHCKVYSHELVWFPAHLGGAVDGIPNPNEMAHARARGLACRPGASGPSRPGLPHPDGCGAGVGDATGGDALTTFNEITNHYKLGRRTLPTPHKELSRGQEIAFRLIQTNTFPSPAIMASYMDISPQCSLCGELATFGHIMWRCPRLQINSRVHRIDETDFYTCITSSDLRSQLWAIQGACEVAGGLGLPVPTWVTPKEGR